MAITVQEILAILDGTASQDLRERFVVEAADKTGSVHELLRGVARWATTSLNPLAPSPRSQESDESPTVAVSVVRKAAFWRGAPAQEGGRPTLDDLVDVLQGRASEEVILLVRQALADETSQLSRLLTRYKRASQ